MEGLRDIQYGMGQRVFSIGTGCFVRAGSSAADCEKVGYVDSASITKNIQTQKANVVGSVMAASIDAQGISVSVSLGGFIATKEAYEDGININGVGKIALASFCPKSQDFIKGKVAIKFPYLDFYDEKEEKILYTVSNAISTSFQMSMNTGAYVKANVSMEAIDAMVGSDYLS